MQQRNLILLLKIICSTLFFGRAWQCFRWKTSINNVLLDPNRMGKTLEWIYDEPLNEIFSERLAEGLIVGIDYTLGGIFLAAGIACIFIDRWRSLIKWFLYLGFAGLFLVYFAQFYNNDFRLGLFFEHTLQLLSPIFLVIAAKKKNEVALFRLLRIATAVTFVCHGLFAVGFYPTPRYFVDMVIKGFGCSEEAARISLLVLGIIDFVFAIAIFIRPIAKPALIYGVLWGFLTALARIYTSFNVDFMENWFSQYMFEFFVRFSHFLAPLILYLFATKRLHRFPLRQR